MVSIIISSFWFLLPAGLANMSPVLFKWIPFLNKPVDLGKKLKGKPIFGKNKTYRGFLVGTLISILTVFLLKTFGAVSIIDYNEVSFVLLGFLLGFGALFGDLVESFFKRRFNIRPGSNWIPWDQVDWIIGALVFAAPLVSYTWQFLTVSILLFGLLHPTINYLGYLLKIKNNKF